MKLRRMELPDLIYVVPMLRAAQAEAGTVFYPWPDAEDMSRIERTLMSGLDDPALGAIVGVKGAKPKALALARLVPRELGRPRVFARLEVLYVEPPFRASGAAAELARAVWQWTHLRLAEFIPEGAERILEVEYVPESVVGRWWEEAGFRPYRVQAAWVGDDGQGCGEPPRPGPLLLSPRRHAIVESPPKEPEPDDADRHSSDAADRSRRGERALPADGERAGEHVPAR